MKRTHLWRRVLVIIMGLFLLAGTACGKKGDPLPPAQPNASQTAPVPVEGQGGKAGERPAQ